jgi:hypothetical protein
MTNPMVPAASYPPLHRTQERSTHSSGTGTEDTEGWATRPIEALHERLTPLFKKK